MKITDVNGPNGSGKPKKTKKTGDKGAFDALLGEAEGASESQETAGAAPASGVEAASLFALQEVSGQPNLRQQTLQQGRQSLQILDELRRDLLLGEDNPNTLRRMRDQQQRLSGQAYDPSLKSVMDDIDLRLSVEIAKREAMLDA
jgi:hypothetical protein